jgi:hypothetical protein
MSALQIDTERQAIVTRESFGLAAPRRLAPFEVLDVLRDLGRDAETYRQLARHTPHERWFRRLSVTDDHDVWLIG